MNWESVLPIQAIENNFLVNGNGDITAVYDLLLPDLYTLSDIEADSITEGFISILKLLPEGAALQKLDYFYTSEYSSDYDPEKGVITHENLKFYDTRPLLKHFSKLAVTFPTGNKKHTDKSNPLLDALGYIFNPPLKDVEKNIEKFTNVLLSFEAALNSIPHIKGYRCDNENLGSTLYEYFSMMYDTPYKGSYKDQILPEYSFENNNLRIGDNFVKIISLSNESPSINPHKFSKSLSGSMFGNGIKNETAGLKTSLVHPVGLGLPIKHILSVTIVLKELKDVKLELDIESRKINVLAMLGNKAASNKIEEIKSYTDTISNNNYQAAELSLSVITCDRDKATADKYAELIRAAFINIEGAGCIIENAEAANLFFAACPGNASSYYRKFHTVTDAAAYYLSKETLAASDLTGHIFIDRYNMPVVVDMWETKTNRNKLVIGPSGSGKSYTLNGILNQTLAQGNHIIIIDIGHSYKRNCELNAGRYFDSSQKKNLSFNIFLCPKDTDGNYLFDLDADGEKSEGKINFIITVLALVWKGNEEMSNESKAVLKNMVGDFYRYINKKKLFPDFHLFYKYISIYQDEHKDIQGRFIDFESILLILKKYTEGEASYLLNATSNIDILNDKFIVFDLEAITNDKELFGIVSLIIIELVIQKTDQLKGVRKTLLIDEGLDFLEDEKMGDFIAYLYRTFRKKEGEVILAAQNINFIKEAAPKIRDSLIINTDTKILLDHSNTKASYKDLQSVLSLTDHAIQVLDSVGFGEMFLQTGNTVRVYKNQYSDFAYCVYTSKQTETEAIHRHYLQCGNMQSAIKNYLNEKK